MERSPDLLVTIIGVLMSGAFDGPQQGRDPIVLAKPFDRAMTGEVDGALGQDWAVSPQAGDDSYVYTEAEWLASGKNPLTSRAVMNRLGHPALYLVDTISSLASYDFRMDEWGVDLVIGGSQKGLMLPPGMAFTAINARVQNSNWNCNRPTTCPSWPAASVRMPSPVIPRAAVAIITVPPAMLCEFSRQMTSVRAP